MKTFLLIFLFFTIITLHAQTHKAIAEIFINDLSQQKYQEAETLTDSVFQKNVSAEHLKQVWEPINVQAGKFNKTDSIKIINENSFTAFGDFDKATLPMNFSFNKENKIIGFFYKYLIMKNADSSIYPQQNLSVNVNAGTIKGILMLPDNANAEMPVALIISGSGPTDRNGNTPLSSIKFNTYKLLAEALAKNGIASFRYDKRGIGASDNFTQTQDQVRFSDFVNDADSIVQFLKTKYSKVFIIGHSEGSLIGVLSSEKEKPNGFVSLAGAGENIERILIRQSSAYSDSTRAREILKELKNGKTDNNVPQTLQNLLTPSVQPYLISWMKYEPENELKKLNCPVLIIQGDADWNVKVKDAENLKAAKPDAQLVIIKEMIHDLINPNNGINELCPEMVDTIISFIKK